jgi:hypothetical protein
MGPEVGDEGVVAKVFLEGLVELVLEGGIALE